MIGPDSTPYLAAADAFARHSGTSRLGALAKVLSLRLRHGLGPYYFAIFGVDGRPPAQPADYITHTAFNVRQRRWNPREHHVAVDDKVAFYLRCRAAGVPTPAVLGVVGTGDDAVPPGIARITSGAELDAAVRAAGASDFFLKPSHGIHGFGASALCVEAGGYRLHGERRESDAVVAMLRAAAPPGQRYLLQPRLRNAAALRPVASPSGLATVRLITRLDDDGFAPLLACLRMTTGTNIVDNFLLGLGGNLTAPIDVDTGVVGVPVASRSPTWPVLVTVRAHPDTQVAIEGFAMPRWREVLETARRGHQAFAAMKVLGWDIGIVEDGPVLVEANHNWDLDILQIAHRRGLGPELARRLGPLW